MRSCMTPVNSHISPFRVITRWHWLPECRTSALDGPHTQKMHHAWGLIPLDSRLNFLMIFISEFVLCNLSLWENGVRGGFKPWFICSSPTISPP